MKLTSDEVKLVVQLYYSNGKSPTQTYRLFNNRALLNNWTTRVTKKNVIDAIKRFELRVDMKKSNRNKPSKLENEDVLFGVLNSLYQKPGNSLRSCATDNDLSVTTTQRAVRQVLKLYPYRLVLTQTLSFFDKMVRFEACHRLVELLATGIDVVFTDEATFYTDGHVNTWNCRIWDYERPENFVAETTQSSKHVTVWAGLNRNYLFGPYFFPNTVTGDSYRGIISEMFIPDLLEKVGDGIADVWFQQDGAPAHTANDTKAFLLDVFGERVISHGFHHEWPPRSPDLTPCDFHLWGDVQEIVYREGPFNDVASLQNAIIAAFQNIRHLKMDHVNNAVLSVPQRMMQCISLEGAQLVHQ
jgi:hypothetical protein